MIEYSRHIEEYANYWQADFSKIVPSNQWGDKKIAEKYLQKYWLNEQDYQKFWKPVQNKIFNQDKILPDMIYRPEFELIALRGGCLFVKEGFQELQKAMHEVGDNYFVIIQNSQDFTEGEPMFRMKFPVNTTWEALLSGNYISSVLFEMSYNEYFVFGESGAWGKYSANDYERPLDIIGFKPEYASIFREKLKQSAEEREEIIEWLPLNYRELIK